MEAGSDEAFFEEVWCAVRKMTDRRGGIPRGGRPLSSVP